MKIGQIIVSTAIVAFMLIWYFAQNERDIIDYAIACGLLFIIWGGPFIGNKLKRK